ncbi:MAG: hypothetical protein IKX36_08465 [Prevotella sp.]|nr:hypothetical protein [Prevotella sp.]
MQKKIILFMLMLMSVCTLSAQKVTFQVKYSYEYDMQKYEYIRRLGYAEGIIVKDGDTAVTLNGKRYKVITKDRDEVTEKMKSVQYTTSDEQGVEHIICFNEEYSYPEELKYQVVVFNANNPYDWTYYITDSGK